MSIVEIKKIAKDIFDQGQQGVEFKKKGQSFSISRIIVDATDEYFVYGINAGNSPASMRVALYETLYFIAPVEAPIVRIEKMREKYETMDNKEEFLKKRIAVERARLIARAPVSASEEEVRSLKEKSKREVSDIHARFKLSCTVDKILEYVEAIADEKIKKELLDLQKRMKEIIPSI